METTLNTKVICEDVMKDPAIIGSFSAVHNWMTKANARANRESETRNEILDYLLVPSDYVQPMGDSGKFAVVPLRASEKWYWSYINKHWPEEKGLHCDLSDHFPVMAEFQFAV